MNRNNWLWTGIVILILIGGGWFVVQKKDGEKASIKIGALIPLTGKLASYGEDMRNSLMLAEEEAQKLTSQKFDTVFEDSAGDAKGGLTGARKLIDIDSTPIIIGGPGSSSNLAVAPVLEERHILFFPTSNTAKLNTAGEYTFKLNPDIDFEVTYMIPKMREEGVRRVAVLYDSGTDTNTAGAKLFQERFTQAGESVVFFEGIDSKTTTDFRTQLTTLKQKAPDALYVFMNAKLSGVLLRQARELGLSTRFFSWSALSDPEFFTSAGTSAEGVIITDQPFSCGGTHVMQEYCGKYKARFSGRTPTSYGVTAYDVFRIISDVLAKNRSSEFRDAERRLIQEAFTSTTYEGVSGTLKFDAEGNIRDKDFVFRVAKDGKFVDLK